ncbi:hypothetical protein KAU11_11170, partial [Candidatus Babeliales bacterium]|nr:hypothetical protein [Candidatus Babeliales bacterium]
NQYRGKSTNQIYDIIYEKKDAPDSNNQDIVFGGKKPEDGDKNSKPQDKQSSAAQEQELKNHIQGILVKAKTQSQMSGKDTGAIPGEILRQIDALINPKLPWDQILNRFLTEKIKDDYTWSRPNRRFMPEFYLPTQNSEALAKITIAIDTSGSISKTDLRNILSEIAYIKDTMKPKELEIIDCDRTIHNIWTVTEDMDLLDLPFTGGGGTSCKPVLEHCRKNPTTALVYFTDLYLDKWTEEMDFPILWIVYNNPGATVPVGEVTHYDINQKR